MDKVPEMPRWMRTFVEDLRQNRRKAVLLGVLAAVGLLLGARAVFRSSSPVAARAAVAPQGASPKGPARPEAGAADLPPREARLDPYIKQIDRTAARDLFAFRGELFTAVEPVIITPVVVSTQPATTQASPPDSAEVERRQALAQARTLTLQSVILGSEPTAIINDRTRDRVLRVGDAVRGFEVLRISGDSCILRKNGVQATLTLEKSPRPPDAPEPDE